MNCLWDIARRALCLILRELLCGGKHTSHNGKKEDRDDDEEEEKGKPPRLPPKDERDGKR